MASLKVQALVHDLVPVLQKQTEDFLEIEKACPFIPDRSAFDREVDQIVTQLQEAQIDSLGAAEAALLGTCIAYSGAACRRFHTNVTMATNHLLTKLQSSIVDHLIGEFNVLHGTEEDFSPLFRDDSSIRKIWQESRAKHEAILDLLSKL